MWVTLKIDFQNDHRYVVYFYLRQNIFSGTKISIPDLHYASAFF